MYITYTYLHMYMCLSCFLPGKLHENDINTPVFFIVLGTVNVNLIE